jgi:hypothetical protein
MDQFSFSPLLAYTCSRESCLPHLCIIHASQQRQQICRTRHITRYMQRRTRQKELLSFTLGRQNPRSHPRAEKHFVTTHPPTVYCSAALLAPRVGHVVVGSIGRDFRHNLPVRAFSKGYIDPTLTQPCMSYDQGTVERPSSGYIVD